MVALAYQFIAYPLMLWAWAWLQAQGWVPKSMQPPPLLDVEALMVLLTGILGTPARGRSRRSGGRGKVTIDAPPRPPRPSNRATMQAIADGSRPVWDDRHPDGDWCCMRDGQRAVQHARDSTGC